MIKKIALGLLIGAGIALFFLQQDEWVQNSIAQTYARMFSQSIGCSFKYARVKNLNLFIPSIELEGVEVRPLQGNRWQWKANSYKTSCSWLHILLHSMIDMYIDINTIEAHSYATDGQPDILEHIYAITTGPALSVPMYIQSLTIKNCHGHLEDLEHSTDIRTVMHCQSHKIKQVWRSSYHIESGTLLFHNSAIIDQAQGTIDVDIGNVYSKNAVLISGSGTISLPRLPAGQHECSLHGQWHNGRGSISIAQDSGNIDALPLTLSYTDEHILLDGIIRTPLSYIWALASGDQKTELNGLCALHLRMHLDDIRNSLQITYDLERVRYHQQPIAQKINGLATCKGALWQGSCNMYVLPTCVLNGLWQWDATTLQGSASLNNVRPINFDQLPHWQLPAHENTITCTFSADGTCDAQYRLTATNIKTGDTFTTSGNLKLDPQRVLLNGAIDERTYTMHANIKPAFQLHQLSYRDEHNQPLLSINTHPEQPEQFEGLLQFPFMRSLIAKHLGYDVQGEGAFTLKGTMLHGIMQAKLSLVNGNIRLPETYNFINSFTCDIDADIFNRHLTLRNMNCALHKGTVSCTQATIQGDEQYKPQFMHVPLVFDSCLLNIKRDIFAILSGALTLELKEHTLPFLHGTVIVDRAQLKENLFSDALQNDLLQFTRNAFEIDGKDMACDLTVETKQPIKITTAFLEATAKTRMHLTHTLREPKISGSVELLSGQLHFPYKSLHITRGSIICLPDQLTDPHIELVAKNSIKKHTVSLQVSGSLKDHHVLLESTPPLTEEQIVALLLVGSTQESLNAVMPALIMQNITNILFASDQSPLKMTEHFNSLLKPFRHIHLTPSFSDQSGRGGLRGALEVDIGEHWHALLQKNFSLTEDTRFELEYLFSDDVSVRGVRDERKDLSVEGEVRWKF